MAEGGDGDDQVQPLRDGGSQHNSPASSTTSLNSLTTETQLPHDLQGINLETSDSTIRPDQRMPTGPVHPQWEQQQPAGVSTRLQPASSSPAHQVTLLDFGPVSVAHPSFVTSIRASRRRGSLPVPDRSRELAGSHSSLSGSPGISASEGSLATHQDFGPAVSAEHPPVKPTPTPRQESNSSVVGNVSEPELPRITTSSESAQSLEDVGKPEESRAQFTTRQAAPSPAAPAAPMSDLPATDTHAPDAPATNAQVPHAPATNAQVPHAPATNAQVPHEPATNAQVPDGPTPDMPDPSESPSENAANVQTETQHMLSKASMICAEFSSANVPDGSASPVEADSGQDTTQPASQQPVSQQPVTQGADASAATVSKTWAVTSALQQLTMKSDASQVKRSPSPQDALAASVGATQRQELPVHALGSVVHSPESQHAAQPATTTEGPTDDDIGEQQTLMRQMSGSHGAGAVSLRRSNSRVEPGDQAAAAPKDASSHDSDSERGKETDRR